MEFCSEVDIELPSQSLNNTTANRHFDNKQEFVIRGRILPEKDPYCLASFLIEIRLPAEYPFKMPEVIFRNPIYHPNVSQNGQLCCWGFNYEKWRPKTTLIDVIKAIINTIDNSHLEYHCNEELVNEYRDNYEKFYETALEYTLKHRQSRH